MSNPHNEAAAYQLAPAEARTCSAMATALRRWGRSHLRQFPWREYSTEFPLLVAELLLQRTRADVVAGFIDRFLEDFPNWQALADVDQGILEARLAPLGLQRRRAKTFQSLAASRLMGDPITPGVGQYVARALGVMLYGEASAMVDSNFVRVLTRVFNGPWRADYRYDPRLQTVAKRLVANEPRLTNLAILDVGALICRSGTPNCAVCPLVAICAYAGASRPRQPAPLRKPQLVKF